MAVWSRSTSFFDSDVYGALYDAAPDDCIGITFCNWAVPNSTDQSGRLLATGSHVAGGNPLTLTATRLPANQFGYFLAARGSNPVGSSPPLSQGLLCLSGAIGRFSRPGEIGFSGPNGSFSLSVDTLDIPLTPVQAILPGETWYFQGWYRDQNPGPTSNFTNAVRIVFE